MRITAAFIDRAHSPSYSASKVALNSYLRALRAALSPYNVHVTAICPGFVETAFTAVTRKQVHDLCLYVCMYSCMRACVCTSVHVYLSPCVCEVRDRVHALRRHRLLLLVHTGVTVDGADCGVCACMAETVDAAADHGDRRGGPYPGGPGAQRRHRGVPTAALSLRPRHEHPASLGTARSVAPSFPLYAPTRHIDGAPTQHKGVRVGV
jgi:hypothetical protein